MEDCKDALTKKTVVLVELREIVQTLNEDRAGRELLTKKIHAATLFKDPASPPARSAHRDVIVWNGKGGRPLTDPTGSRITTGSFEIRRPGALTQRSLARYRHWPFRCCYQAPCRGRSNEMIWDFRRPGFWAVVP